MGIDDDMNTKIFSFSGHGNTSAVMSKTIFVCKYILEFPILLAQCISTTSSAIMEEKLLQNPFFNNTITQCLCGYRTLNVTITNQCFIALSNAADIVQLEYDVLLI